MSNSQITPAPRFLLFPQVERAEAPGKRPRVRRYSLTLLPSAAASPQKAKRALPGSGGLTTA